MEARQSVVAIVDDDRRMLDSLAELLGSAGYAALKFSSARALLERDLSSVDLLITDIGMAGMDGFELRDLVKKSYPAMPVFMITGRHELADQAQARGIDDCFRKPFDAQALLAAVQKAIDS